MSKREEVLAAVTTLLQEVELEHEALELAAKYCPQPWAGSLAAIASSWLFVSFKLMDIRSQLEAIFDDGSDHLSQDVEGPGE
jgi:hypothetical protein